MARIVSFLTPLRGSIYLWSDAAIMPGAEWNREIDNAINTAQIAILLISPSYLSSPFIREIEIPKIFKLSQAGKISVIPIILEPCLVENSPLSLIQSLNPPSDPLSRLPIEQRDKYLTKLAGLITERTIEGGMPTNTNNKTPDDPELYANIFFKAESSLKVAGEIK